MSDKSFYDKKYHVEYEKVNTEIRIEVFGEDIGQAGWASADECRKYFSWMEIDESTHALDVACGTGGSTIFMAQVTGTGATGVDISPDGIRAAIEQTKQSNISDKVTFQVVDAGNSLPFSDESFDAIYCNDAINHLPNRLAVLQDWCRLLKPGGRLVYTDPIMVTGILSSEEIAIRSSIGYFVYTPIGENERLLKQAGFELLRSENVSDSTTNTAKRAYDAREKRKEVLIGLEGSERFEKTQQFARVCYELSESGCLSRFAYLAHKRM